jgi:hypothetical protein
MANKLISISDTNAVIAFTSTDEENIIDIVSVNKFLETIDVKNIEFDRFAKNHNSTQFMEELN